MDRGQGKPQAEAWHITLALLLVVLGWDALRLDLPLAHLAGSASGFPWRDHWVFASLMHEGGRRLAWLLEVVLCLAVWWPLGPLTRLPQRQRLQLALTTLLGALAVSTLKFGSHTSCPWDLSEFGGFAHYTSHWSLRPDGGAGQCFPAGHAASGFGFLGGYFVFRATQPRLARTWLAGSLGMGMVLGLAQQWRGAHFMSHTLWSAAVCWCVAWAVDVLMPRAWTPEGI
jgi:membrane-associated PAP2 superfamily phosphatase